MDKNELLAATFEAGVPPLETLLTEVRSTSTRQVIACRSVLRFNTQQLGVLLPADFEPVASRTAQSVKIALAGIAEVGEIISTAAERGIKLDFFSVSCPVRMLTRGNIAELLETAFEENFFPDPAKLCLEFPAQLLFEDSGPVAERLAQLRFMGVKTAISGFGDPFCPTMRLAAFPFDYAILERGITSLMENDNTAASASSLVSYVRGLGIEAIATGAVGNEIISRFYQSDCTGYIPEPDRLLTLDEALPDKKGY